MTRTHLPPLLLTGDGLTILAVTWIGFLTHKESLLDPRWLTTFLPLVAAWALVAPWLGNYRDSIACNPRQFWRAGWAMVLAAPLAGLLRALMLSTVVTPIFVFVVGGISAVGMMIWRLAYAWFANKTGRHG